MAQKKPFLLRLSQEMWQELERWAAEEFRSVNGQIEYILSDALRRRGRAPAPQLQPRETSEAGDK